MAQDEMPLPAGRMTAGITRRGGSVFRPVGSWSAAVHEYLGHLGRAGFDGAPRVLGVRDGREELTFLEGEVGVDPDWEPGLPPHLPGFARSDDALAAAGRLIRRLHEASRGFVPEHVGYRFHPHPPRPGEIVCHGDLGPWNTVYRDGLPVAFIDWDAAGPRDPVVDVAAAARAFVPLASGVPVEGARLRLFADAYGLADRRRILPALTAATLATTENIRSWPLDAAGLAGALEFVAGELRWLHGVLPSLERALSGHD
ncbi:phosphotransferase [Actinoplanes sp. NPDC051343]|uniref:phosphotransferase n=1 Tax=Actinoplanes sp. NPDC051343 TaxID=3363906 RepID=UPI0037B86429